MGRWNFRGLKAGLFATVAVAAMSGTAWAQEKAFDIPTQPVSAAVAQFARQADVQVLVPGRIAAGKSANAVRGAFTVEEGLNRLLQGTGLSARLTAPGTYVVSVARPQADAGASAEASAPPPVLVDEVVVTGSRIRGATAATPVITRTPEAARDQGQATVADILASIPQNFYGGQNPGLGSTTGGFRNTGASTINLRGIGPSATLTLLNGHRLAYDSQLQAIDISAIPFEALDRIEIVADGASAIYGSDAVGGVANLILKRDYQGFSASARFGASTDGGNEQQQYGIVTGSAWGSGGLMLAYQYRRNGEITATDRDYTAKANAGLTLYPEAKQHSVAFVAHQDLRPNLSVMVDMTYGSRSQTVRQPFDGSGNIYFNGSQLDISSKTFNIAPSLKWTLPHGWQMTATGMYGRDHAGYTGIQYSNGVKVYPSIQCFCNDAQSVEVAATGPVFTLPAGVAEVAVGAGERAARSNNRLPLNPGPQNFTFSQRTNFAYGEINIPLVSPQMGLFGIHKLDLTGAARYEDVKGIDQVVTPKVGLVYSPTEDFELKASWGKSFKAPTISQIANPTNIQLRTATSLGGVSLPATALLLAGGSSEGLRPERAKTWSTTLVVHPRRLEGLRAEISYYNIDYRDRIVAPISISAQSLSNPIYANLVQRNPSEAAQAAAIASASLGFYNSTGLTYTPSDVVAIIDNRNRNVTAQVIDGFDLNLSYKIDMGDERSLAVDFNANHLTIKQQLNLSTPQVQISGNLYNPPSNRGRAGVIYRDGGLTLSSYVNYTGSVRDVRTAAAVELGSMTTWDLTARYRVQSQSRLYRGIDLELSAQNIFDRAPPLMKSSLFYENTYDSTNYSPFGRVINVGIVKRW